jgi:NTP pyrophosphatase (non-canonical NTP hydrolase)
MNLQLYTEQAKRTESYLDTDIKLNLKYITSLSDLIIAAGNLLDQIKKNVFYHKPINLVLTNKLKFDVEHALSKLNLIPNPEKDKITLPVNFRVFHAIVGITTEASELMEALDFYTGKMDTVNILEECFDVDWYQFILMDELNGGILQVWETGFNKLKKRYPEKFTNTAAINRNVIIERGTLEDGFQMETK